MSSLFPPHWPLFIAAAALSLALSLIQVLQQDILNFDAVLYLQMAERLKAEDWQGALALYKWPLYPWLIAQLAQLLRVDLQLAAHSLNALLTVGVIWGYMAITLLLGGERRHLVVAAIIVLGYPWLNDMRPLLVRDWGYWACFLLGVGAALSYGRHGTLWRWSLAMALLFGATLFRIEGLLFVIVVLIGGIIKGIANPRWRWLSVGVVGLAGLFAALWVVARWFSYLHLEATTVALLDDLQRQLLSQIEGQRQALREHVLSPFAVQYTDAVYGAMVAVVLMGSVATRLTLPYGALLLYGYWQKLPPVGLRLNPWMQGLLAAIVVVNLVILLGFLVTKGFLARRYPIALCLILLLPLPFFVVALWQRWRAGLRRRLLTLLLGLTLVWMVGDALVATGVDRRYLREVGAWVRQHVPQEADFYSNVHQLIWYAGRSEYHHDRDYSWQNVERTLAQPSAREQWLAVRLKVGEGGRQQWLVAQLGEPVAQFDNGQGDRALVFKRLGGAPAQR